jgi:hypothetical protein
MKKCKSCQKQIDDKAKKCPHCQSDQRSWFRRHPIITGLIGLFVIGMVISAASGGSDNSSKTNDTANSSQQKDAVQQPTVVEATALIGEFDNNKLSANDKYNGKLVETTGFIKNISNDVTGNYYLSLNPNNEEYYFGTTITCYFTDKNELTSLSNGQSITVQGTMQEMTLGIVAMKDCKVVK